MAYILDNNGVVMLKFSGVTIVRWLYRRMPCFQKTEESMREMAQRGRGQNRGKIQHNSVSLGEEYCVIAFRLFRKF